MSFLLAASANKTSDGPMKKRTSQVAERRTREKETGRNSILETVLYLGTLRYVVVSHSQETSDVFELGQGASASAYKRNDQTDVMHAVGTHSPI